MKLPILISISIRNAKTNAQNLAAMEGEGEGKELAKAMISTNGELAWSCRQVLDGGQEIDLNESSR